MWSLLFSFAVLLLCREEVIMIAETNWAASSDGDHGICPGCHPDDWVEPMVYIILVAQQKMLYILYEGWVI